MISFEKIDKYSLRYALLFKYTKLIHNHVYNSSFHIIGKENIPPKGTPTLVISNHQNGLLDALGILFSFRDGRQPVFIARGDIFNNPIAAKLLRFLKIMPAFRTIDVAKSEVGKSNVTFLRAARVLIEGGTVAIFPEAGHEDCHRLGTFKKGFPRIAFKAEEEADFKLNLTILPVANHYSNYTNFRQKKVIVIGKPFKFSELIEVYKSKPNDAYLQLNEKSRAIIKEMMLDVEDLETYAEYRTLTEIVRHDFLEKMEKNTTHYPDHLWADKIITEKIDCIKKDDPPLFQQLIDKAKEYNTILHQYNLRNWLIGKKNTLIKNIFATLMLIILSPLFLFGFFNNFLPFFTPSIFTRKIKDKMLHSSFNIVVGALISFPIFYLIYLLLGWCLFGSFITSLLYLFLVFVTLFEFFEYKVNFIKNRASWRYWRLQRKKDSSLQRAIFLKKDLKEHLFPFLIHDEKM